MRKKPNNKLIGLFIISGVALFMAIIGMFISEKMVRDDKDLVVMYFSESIMGLDVGSQVVFKGVSVGKVAKIDIITDPHNLNFSIPVYATFDTKNLSAAESPERLFEVLQALVNKGLRARLASQNMLTGQLMIELEFIQDAGKPVYRAPNRDIPEIPTVLSQYAELSQGIQDIPLKETFKKINVFLDSLNNEITPQIQKLVADFGAIPQNTSSIPVTLSNFNNAVKNVPTTLNSFNQAMQNISSAAKTINNLADYLERHPESLIRGKGGN